MNILSLLLQSPLDDTDLYILRRQAKSDIIALALLAEVERLRREGTQERQKLQEEIYELKQEKGKTA